MPDLSAELLVWISQAQIQCPRVCHIPSLTAPLCPVGISQAMFPFWKILVPVAPPDCFGPSAAFASLHWELFQEQSLKGHTLFPFPPGPLWGQLPFHFFCFIGLFKGCQLDLGEWGFLCCSLQAASITVEPFSPGNCFLFFQMIPAALFVFSLLSNTVTKTWGINPVICSESGTAEWAVLG